MSHDRSALADANFDDGDDRGHGPSAEPPIIEILERRLSRREPRRRALAAAFGLGAFAALPLTVLRRLRPAEARAAQPKALRRWKCPTDECGYIYDPAAGDPEHGVPPGTAFEDLPADWVCPNSGTPKDRFSPL